MAEKIYIVNICIYIYNTLSLVTQILVAVGIASGQTIWKHQWNFLSKSLHNLLAALWFSAAPEQLMEIYVEIKTCYVVTPTKSLSGLTLAENTTTNNTKNY